MASVADLGIELRPYHAHNPDLKLNDLSPGTDDSFPLLPETAVLRSAENRSGAGLGSAVFNLTTTIIGAGIMALPATMKVLGLPLGFLAIVAMGLVSEASIEMLIIFSNHFCTWSYGETVQTACKSAGRKLAEVCIIVNNAGILIVYLIIIGEVLSGSKSGDHVGLLEQLAGGQGWWSNRSLTIFCILLVVLAPLCFLRHIDSLRFSSAVSVILAVLFVILLAGIALVKLILGTVKTPRLLPDASSALDLLVVIPIMTNAFICHFNVHPIYCELHHRTPTTMTKVGRISTALCVIVYAITAIAGYLLFGDSTAPDVLTNFDKDLGIRYSSVLNAVIRVGYVVHLLLVFPVIHFSLRQTVESLFLQKMHESSFRFNIITVLLLTLIYFGSAFIPNIWVAFQFTGATTGLSLGFIFPALLGIRWSNLVDVGSTRQRIIFFSSWIMLVMATVVSVIGIAGNIISLVKGMDH